MMQPSEPGGHSLNDNPFDLDSLFGATEAGEVIDLNLEGLFDTDIDIETLTQGIGDEAKALLPKEDAVITDLDEAWLALYLHIES